jgi:2'-5' RNA ligase
MDKEFLRENVRFRLDRYFEVDRVCLMKSTLRPSGPRYEVLHESPLV